MGLNTVLRAAAAPAVAPLVAPVHPETISHPLVEDLKRTAQSTLSKQLERMFSAAGDMLLAMSETANTEAERHAHFDAMRVLGFEQARILRGFEHELARAFGAPAPASITTSADLHQPLLPQQELEENLVLSRAAGNALNRSRNLIAALEQRLETIEHDLHLPPVHRVLSPRNFCDIYCTCLNRLDLGYSVRNLLVKLFEQTVLTSLEPVYHDLHAALDRHSPRIEPPPEAQLHNAGSQREQLLARVRRVVGYELAALINGRRLHPGARVFLCCAMAPLMSVRLMRHGVHSKLWHDALTRVAHILRSLEPRLHQPEQAHARNEFIEAMSADLRDIGFTEIRIRELLGALQQAYDDLDADPSTARSAPRIAGR